MSTESNKIIVNRIFEEAFNNRNVAIVDELIAPSFINHNSQARGSEGVKHSIIAQINTFPDIHTTIEDIIAEGDKVVVRATDHFTRQSDGKQMSLAWIEIIRLESGKAIESWFGAESSSVFEQITHALE